jgi:mRNA interferase YafQ
MEMGYKIKTSQYFLKKAKKIIKNSNFLSGKLDKAVEYLASNPFTISLKTHKIRSKKFGIMYSSRLTGDLKIIWQFTNFNNEKVIELVDIGGHSGNNSVY